MEKIAVGQRAAGKVSLDASVEDNIAATGISDGDLLKGVVYYGNERARTQSIVMRAKTGTVRFINAIHNFKKLEMLK